MRYIELDKYKYKLCEDERIFLPQTFGPHVIETDWVRLSNNILVVKKGYCWDGASGPTADTPNTMLGALAHDALYQLIRIELMNPSLKNKADLCLKQICIAETKRLYGSKLRYLINKARFFLWYRAVKRFGKYHMNIGEAQDIVYEI